jgi:hypothetical protein
MKLATGRAQLFAAMKTLVQQWEETRRDWNDPVSRELEEHHISPLQTQVQDTLRAIDRLAAVLGEMRRECGDRE